MVSRPAVRTVAVTPVTLLTLRATGGVGALRFAMAGDDAGVATVGADSGAVVVTSLLAGGRATVSILVTDATPVNRMTVAVTMAFVGSLGFVTDSARLVVSPDFAGALYTLTATGGGRGLSVFAGGGAGGGDGGCRFGGGVGDGRVGEWGAGGGVCGDG